VGAQSGDSAKTRELLASDNVRGLLAGGHVGREQIPYAVVRRSWRTPIHRRG